MPVAKQRAYAATGSSGVRGDGARGKGGRGTWETRSGGGDDTDVRREYITVARLLRESEGFIVALKRLTPVERRDPAVGVWV
jgi:hypothetical protein